MIEPTLATPDVMLERIKFYYDDYAWQPLPERFLGDMTLDEFAIYLSESFEPLFEVDDDFMMSWEVKDSIYLETYVGEIDAYIDQMIGETR
jgi:hypothetical protein